MAASVHSYAVHLIIRCYIDSNNMLWFSTTDNKKSCLGEPQRCLKANTNLKPPLLHKVGTGFNLYINAKLSSMNYRIMCRILRFQCWICSNTVIVWLVHRLGILFIYQLGNSISSTIDSWQTPVLIWIIVWYSTISHLSGDFAHQSYSTCSCIMSI
jgi:hypothetical protein